MDAKTGGKVIPGDFGKGAAPSHVDRNGTASSAPPIVPDYSTRMRGPLMRGGVLQHGGRPGGEGACTDQYLDDLLRCATEPERAATLAQAAGTQARPLGSAVWRRRKRARGALAAARLSARARRERQRSFPRWQAWLKGRAPARLRVGIVLASAVAAVAALVLAGHGSVVHPSRVSRSVAPRVGLQTALGTVASKLAAQVQHPIAVRAQRQSSRSHRGRRHANHKRTQAHAPPQHGSSHAPTPIVDSGPAPAAPRSISGSTSGAEGHVATDNRSGPSSPPSTPTRPPGPAGPRAILGPGFCSC